MVLLTEEERVRRMLRRVWLAARESDIRLMEVLLLEVMDEREQILRKEEGAEIAVAGQRERRTVVEEGHHRQLLHPTRDRCLGRGSAEAWLALPPELVVAGETS